MLTRNSDIATLTIYDFQRNLARVDRRRNIPCDEVHMAYGVSHDWLVAGALFHGSGW